MSTCLLAFFLFHLFVFVSSFPLFFRFPLYLLLSLPLRYFLFSTAFIYIYIHTHIYIYINICVQKKQRFMTLLTFFFFMADIVFLCSDTNVESQRFSWSRILSSFDGFDAATSCPSLSWNCDFRRGLAGGYTLRLKTSIDCAHSSLKVSSNLFLPPCDNTNAGIMVVRCICVHYYSHFSHYCFSILYIYIYMYIYIFRYTYIYIYICIEYLSFVH